MDHRSSFAEAQRTCRRGSAAGKNGRFVQRWPGEIVLAINAEHRGNRLDRGAGRNDWNTGEIVLAINAEPAPENPLKCRDPNRLRLPAIAERSSNSHPFAPSRPPELFQPVNPGGGLNTAGWSAIQLSESARSLLTIQCRKPPMFGTCWDFIGTHGASRAPSQSGEFPSNRTVRRLFEARATLASTSESTDRSVPTMHRSPRQGCARWQNRSSAGTRWHVPSGRRGGTEESGAHSSRAIFPKRSRATGTAAPIQHQEFGKDPIHPAPARR